MPRRVLIATYEELPELDVDGPALIAALRAEGIDAEPVVWTRCSRPSEPVLIRSTWDYPQQPTDFVAWVRSLRAVINSSAMIEWNVDKRYLAELRDRGVPVVPTWFLVPDTGPTLAELVAGELASTYPGSEIVVKPAIGASSCDTIRVDPRNDDDMASAGRLVESIHRSGRAVLVQPYLARIDSDGEVSLVYFDGDYSHAVLRQPVLVPERGEVHPEVEETRLIDATPAMLEIATNTLDVVTDLVHRPVYARIDLLPGDTGHLLGEIELIEPSLFLHAPGAPARFARAISQALSSPDLTGFAPYVPRVTTALGPRTVAPTAPRWASRSTRSTFPATPSRHGRPTLPWNCLRSRRRGRPPTTMASASSSSITDATPPGSGAAGGPSTRSSTSVSIGSVPVGCNLSPNPMSDASGSWPFTPTNVAPGSTPCSPRAPTRPVISRTPWTKVEPH